METLKITKGELIINPVETLYFDLGIKSPLIKNGERKKGFNFKTVARVHHYFSDDGISLLECENNAKLYVDAHNSYNKNPILPSELLKINEELVGALSEMVKFAHFHGYTFSTEINNAKELIQNYKQ